MMSIWNARGTELKQQGVPVEVVWNGAVRSVSTWCVLKGAPNRKLAWELIEFASQPKPQAEFNTRLYYGPIQPGRLCASFRRRSPCSCRPTADNEAVSVKEDDEWEADRIAQIEERFTQWLARRNLVARTSEERMARASWCSTRPTDKVGLVTLNRPEKLNALSMRDARGAVGDAAARRRGRGDQRRGAARRRTQLLRRLRPRRRRARATKRGATTRSNITTGSAPASDIELQPWYMKKPGDRLGAGPRARRRLRARDVLRSHHRGRRCANSASRRRATRRPARASSCRGSSATRRRANCSISAT